MHDLLTFKKHLNCDVIVIVTIVRNQQNNAVKLIRELTFVVRFWDCYGGCDACDDLSLHHSLSEARPKHIIYTYSLQRLMECRYNDCPLLSNYREDNSITSYSSSNRILQ